MVVILVRVCKSSCPQAHLTNFIGGGQVLRSNRYRRTGRRPTKFRGSEAAKSDTLLPLTTITAAV